MEKTKYELVIGLEVHAQLLTKSKIFAPDPNAFGASANKNISVITLGHPGVLPKLNTEAVRLAVRFGLAVNSKITQFTTFDRKNYFYPDLPKGYQISQDKAPICVGGSLTVKVGNQESTVAIHHAHLEEDAGKSIHDEHGTESLLDYNRAGTPLIEIVTDPTLHSGEEAGAFLSEMRRLLRYLDICDGNMEEGSLRCDVNISVRPEGTKTLGTKVEIKNMNSVKFLQKAVEYEFQRQIEVLENNGILLQETRTFDPDTGKTYGMRVKETMNDYRYFPEPDLVPVVISDETIALYRAEMPPLPQALVQKYMAWGIIEADALAITESQANVAYFEETCGATPNKKAAANWFMGPVRSWVNENKSDISTFAVRPSTLAEVIALIDNNTISHTAAAQRLWPVLLEKPNEKPLSLAKELQLIQEGNTDTLQVFIDEVLSEYPDKVQEFRKGKKGLLGLFVGEVMKKSKGQADPKITNQLVLKSLNG